MFEYAPGATPLDPDEASGLIPQHITTQSQLNEWEQVNILEAEKWIVRQHFKSIDILTIDFAKKLHHKMFNNTWRWAGQFRKSNKNTGVDWFTIPPDLQMLIENTHYQLFNNTYSTYELAVRFHHQLGAVK